MYIIGLGCDRDTAAASIATAVMQSLAEAGVSPAAISAAATIDKKADEAGLLSFCQQQGWPLTFYAATALAQVAVPNPSEVVRRHVGTPAVAEAAALLLAGELAGYGTALAAQYLFIEKARYRDAAGRNVTVSLVKFDGKE
ncbi:MAG: cobalamin biosynthesis protein [Gammaproteobacteria bacterium]|nr:cobalamin biosynthesis protein [Gammaproteobacteria bacterium]